MKKYMGYIVFYAFSGLFLLPMIAYVAIALIEKDISVSVFLNNVSFSYFLDLAVNPEVYKSYFKINPINVACWGLIGYGLFMLFLSNFGPNEKKRFEQTEEYGSHGTARWQKEKEVNKNYYDGPREGWFLGQTEETHFSLEEDAAVHAVQNGSELNVQINAVGPPGSNKTTGFVYPNMFYIPYAYRNSKEKPDIIVTDPKGEILAYTGQYYKDNNYDIKIIDFLHLEYGDAVNPLAYIQEEKDVMKIATGFVGAAGLKDAKSQSADPIWELGEGLLLAALIAFVIEVYPKEEHTFEKVGQILASPNLRDMEKAETLFKRHNVTGFGEELWNKFLNLEDKLRSGVVGSLSIKMTLFSLTRVKRITGKNSFNFRDLGRKKDKPLAIFIQMPDEDRTYSPIINTIITMMIQTMYATARETHSKLQNPVYMILEEIANIGRLPGIEELLGTMRGRRIYPMMIWQDLVQMKKLFGDSWEGIVAKCDTQIYLGVNDQFTAKYISEKLGKTTIQVQGKSEKAGGIMSSNSPTQSESHSQRPLLFPDEVERFNNKKFIAIQRSRQPVVLYKTQYKFWENDKKIAEPLELDQLPLIDRLYEEKKAMEQEISEGEKQNVSKEEVAAAVEVTKEIEPLINDDEPVNEEIIIQNDINNEYVVVHENEVEIEFEKFSNDEIIDDDDFEFDEIEPAESEFVVLPASEVDR